MQPFQSTSKRRGPGASSIVSSAPGSPLSSWQLVGFLLLCLLGALSPASADDRYASAIEAGRALIHERLESLPGFSVAVGVDGDIVWSEGFGLADVESATAVTTRTQFRIGSTSKPITTALAGRLLEQGKLDLDQDIRVLFPAFPDKQHIITLRQLLTHQSGIRHYKGMESMNRLHYETLEEGLSLFADDPLAFEPGTRFLYSSYAFNLAGVLLELAGGADFPTLLEREVFHPLGMTSSGPDDATRVIPERATFYSRGKDGPRKAITVDDGYKLPSGGLISTPSDLVRFGSAFLALETNRNGTLQDERPWLTSETIALLLAPQTLRNREATGYALGWRVQAAKPEADPPSPRVIHHGGSSMGGRSMLLVMPDDGIVVSTLTNSDAYETKERDAGAIAGFFLEAKKGN